ncbi:MAG: hypothetical protein HY267_06670, partial [Deltaproteobacteria bacterium]|nr:hypothetical protein [Deltaproteobacteria bacterium]
PTVQGILAARIDRLAPDEKALLQQLAVIGREFPLSLVRHVIAQPEDELYRLLASLQHKEFLYEQPAFPEVEYIFKHALTQEVAYGSVLHERRKVLHEQTGQAIEALYSTNLDEHYSELAHHYQRSGNTEKAIEYLQKAGQQAVQRSANEEAISQLKTALTLIETLPATPERAQQELTLQLTLGPALMFTQGYGAPEVGLTYDRARALCLQINESPQLFQALRGLFQFSIVRGELRKARELGEQLLVLAQHAQDPIFLVSAHMGLGGTLFRFGEWELSQTHLNQALALDDGLHHHAHTFLSGQNPRVGCLSLMAWILWFLGYPDQSLKAAEEALTTAYELGHSFTLAFALQFGALFHVARHENDIARLRIDAGLALCQEHGFSYSLAVTTILQGADWVRQKRGKEGIARMREGQAAQHATGGRALQVFYWGLLAEAYGSTEQYEEGLLILEEAFEFGRETEERWYEAELYRLKGELLLQQENQKAKVKND